MGHIFLSVETEYLPIVSKLQSLQFFFFFFDSFLCDSWHKDFFYWVIFLWNNPSKEIKRDLNWELVILWKKKEIKKRKLRKMVTSFWFENEIYPHHRPRLLIHNFLLSKFYANWIPFCINYLTFFLLIILGFIWKYAFLFSSIFCWMFVFCCKLLFDAGVEYHRSSMENLLESLTNKFLIISPPKH